MQSATRAAHYQGRALELVFFDKRKTDYVRNNHPQYQQFRTSMFTLRNFLRQRTCATLLWSLPSTDHHVQGHARSQRCLPTLEPSRFMLGQ